MCTAKPTDLEPFPRSEPQRARHTAILYDGKIDLPRPRELPQAKIASVLAARRSAVGGPIPKQILSDLLFHTMRKRRGGIGRFERPWEGRAAPSAGGLHPIRLLVIPTENGDPIAIYDAHIHCLKLLQSTDELRLRNLQSVAALTSAKAGTTLQFIADPVELAGCYENWESLLWRDSGALAATISLVAAAMELTCVVLGRTGHDVLAHEAWANSFIGVGGVHLGYPTKRNGFQEEHR